ncbi:acyl-CoA dehydrogenase family protein [Streptomyces nogalater]
MSDEVLAQLRSSGILAAAVPAAYGGLGADAATTNDLIRQVAAADPSVAIILFQHYAVTARISEWATEEQKRRFLPRSPPASGSRPPPGARAVPAPTNATCPPPRTALPRAGP